MIEIGKIRIRDEASVVEARNKVKLLAHDLEFGSIGAARIAAITSDLTRDMINDKGSRIVVGIKKEDERYGLVLNFETGMKEMAVGRAANFFDNVRVVATDDRQNRIEAFKFITNPQFEPTAEFVDNEKERLIRFSKEELMSELKRKNHEILDLYENVKRQKEEIEKWNEKLEGRVKQRTAELEEAHTNLKDTTQMMLQAEKMGAVGTMTAGVAHELNNPLMGILNFIQFCLERTEQEDRRYTYLRKAEDAARRCADIVKNLLTFSHMDKGEIENAYVQQHIHVIFNRIVDLISYRVSGGDIKLDLNYEDSTPPVWMMENSIQQVFLNLVVNAMDAVEESERKEIRIDIKPDGEYVHTSVSDTGHGITAESLPKIFDPFFTTKPVGKGTGLGLSVSRNIISKHGGVIECESEPGTGTTFNILLPIERRKNP